MNIFVVMQNSTEIFSIALGLQDPWQIKEVRFNAENRQLNIYLSFTRGYKFKGYDGLEYTAYDTVTRGWQHLNFFQHKYFIHAKVPRIKHADGTVKTQAVP